MIRAATLNDLDDLVKLEKKAFDPMIYSIMPRRQFKYLIEKGNAEIWVEERNNILCGSATLLYRKNSQMIRFYSLSVDPDFQGGEIGKDMFKFAESRVKDKNLKGMLLEIRGDNTRLFDRYMRLGYSKTYTVPNYYPDGEMCIKLKKVF